MNDEEIKGYLADLRIMMTFLTCFSLGLDLGILLGIILLLNELM